MKANRLLLLRTLTRTAPSLSSQTLLHLSSSAAKASAPKSAAKAPKKKWKMFDVDPPSVAAAVVKSQPPKAIQLREDICNSASFVGTVTGPVQRIDAPGGRVGACASLLVKGSSDDNRSFKILLKMWDETAEMCLEHIKQNDFLHVSGRVESNTKTDEYVKSQTCCEVVVKEINYVAESEHIPIDKNVGLSDSGESEYISIDMSDGESEHSPISKNAGKSEHSPIYKNAEKPDSRGVSYLEKRKARLLLWQRFFTNPSEWSDNRTNKLKPNFPDFKHKDSGEALWINDSDPPWLKEKLQQLNSKHVAQDHKPPTGESLRQQPSESSRQQQSGESGLEKHRARLRMWQTFFTDPTKWYDIRNNKVNPKQPDFRHKESGEVLWINPRDPPWVQVQLQQLDSKPAKQDYKKESTSKF